MSDTTEIDFDGLQAVAEAANQEEWIYHDREVFAPGIGSVCQTYGPMETEASPNGRHIAAFDPSTALALLALARRAVDAEAEAARLREENAASARALESAIKWFVAPCRTRIGKVIGWRCGCWVDLDTPPPCPRESVPHIPECPVPRMEAALAQAKGGAK